MVYHHVHHQHDPKLGWSNTVLISLDHPVHISEKIHQYPTNTSWGILTPLFGQQRQVWVYDKDPVKIHFNPNLWQLLSRKFQTTRNCHKIVVCTCVLLPSPYLTSISIYILRVWLLMFPSCIRYIGIPSIPDRHILILMGDQCNLNQL